MPETPQKNLTPGWLHWISSNPFFVAIGALLVIRGLCYWIFSCYLFPTASMDFHAIFRLWGDTQYYPLIRALSDFQFGEPNVLEYLGVGRIAFPFVSVSPHAAAFGLFGAYGFPIMDLLFVCLQSLVFLLVFRSLHFGKILAASLSLFIVTNTLNYFFVIHEAIFAKLSKGSVLYFAALVTSSISFYLYWKWKWPTIGAILAIISCIFLLPHWELPNAIFQMRIPRPLVTDVFFWGGIIAILTSRRFADKSFLCWGLFGLCLSLTLQGNFHSAAVLGLFALIWLFTELSAPNRLRPAALNAVSAGASFLFASTSFIYQRLTETSEQGAQLGVNILNRLKPVFLTSRIEISQLLFCIFIALCCELVRRQQKENANSNLVSKFIVALTLASYFALPFCQELWASGHTFTGRVGAVPLDAATGKSKSRWIAAERGTEL